MNWKVLGSGFCRAFYSSRTVNLPCQHLDGIRGDLVNQGETGPGGLEMSGVLQHTLGREEASSLFFIEGRGLVRLTVTGPDRQLRLEELAAIAKGKLEGS